MESAVKSIGEVAKGTPEEEGNIALYKSSPFFPHLAPVHFYLDNPSIPLEVRRNMLQLQGMHASIPGQDNTHSFLLFLERYAHQGENGPIHRAVERALYSWADAMVVTEPGSRDRSFAVLQAWESLDKELMQMGETSEQLFHRDGAPRPQLHPAIAGAGGRVASMFLLSERENYSASATLDLVKSTAWQHHTEGCWDSYQRDQMEFRVTERYLDSLITGSGIHELADRAQVYRQQMTSNAKQRSTSLEISQKLLSLDYELLATLYELSNQARKVHILEHHERITPERLKEFSNLAQEYNMDWALAAMDWSGGEPSRVNRIDYGRPLWSDSVGLW